MYKIALCIPTYKRVVMLEKLLNTINNQKINEKYISKIDIVILDNDVDRTAEEKINEFKTIFKDPISIEYHNYTQKGLSSVRNQLLKIVLPKDADYMLSIDDDGIIVDDWLEQIMHTIVDNKADIALGPLGATYEVDTPKSISYWFERPDFDDQTQVDYFQSAHYAISVPFIKKHNLNFDMRLNKRGWEDTYFGLQAMQKGAKVFWAKYAISYEMIPPQRGNINWLAKRWYRGTLNYVDVLKWEKEYLTFIKKMITSVIYIPFSIICLPLLLTKHKYKYLSVKKFVEGIGGIAGMLSFKNAYIEQI